MANEPNNISSTESNGAAPKDRPRPAPESPGLIPRLNTRIPLFEIVLLLVAASLAWVTFEAHTALNEINRRTPPQPKFQQAQEIRTVEPVETILPAEPREPQKPQDLQEILNLSVLLDLKNRYVDITDNLEPGLAELRTTLQNFVQSKDRTEIRRFRARSQVMSQWIQKQEQNLDTRKLRTLHEWLATLPATNTASLSINLEDLLGNVRRSFSNYLASIPITEGQRLTPDLVQTMLARSQGPAEEILATANVARSQAAAIAAFIKERQTPVAPSAPAPMPVIKAAAPTTTTVIRPIGDGGASFIAEFTNLQDQVRELFQPLLYLLIGVLIVQCIVAIVAAYNRIVVLPLRQKLIEDNTAIEHQRKLTHFARLATGLAHEIRNPLTAISVRLFTLQKSLKAGSSEQGDALLIRNEIDRLEQILKNFLKLARPNEPKTIQIHADAALREAADLLAPQLKRRNIEVKLAETTSTPFMADPLQLKQVLINLIQNAAESIDGKGTVTLRAHESTGSTAGRAVVLEVEDTGSGISPEVEERLFDPFFSTKDNGTGLGLPIAAKIIEQHKGILDFETRPGDGSVFRITLPASSQ